MSDVNSVTLCGNMTKEIEVKYSPNGLAVGRFSLAVNKSVKSASGQWENKASFFDIRVFGSTAENVQKYTHKGSKVVLSGILEQATWEDNGQKRSNVYVIANTINFIAQQPQAVSRQAQPVSQQAPQDQQWQQPQAVSQQQPQQYGGAPSAQYTANPPQYDDMMDIPF